MIYEFLYRGPIPENGDMSAYHVVIGEFVVSFGERKLITKGPLTPQQASDLGWPLDKILGRVAEELAFSLDVEKAAHLKTINALDKSKRETLNAINASADIARENIEQKKVIENLLRDVTTLDEAVRVQALRADTAETKYNQEMQAKAQLASVDAAKEPGLMSRALSFIGFGPKEQ